MEIFAGLSVALLILVALIVVTKTFGLWLRTRGLPELLLSLMLVCATILGYPLAIASTLIPAGEMWPIHVGSQAITSLGFACLLLFTLNVFRPDSVWARSLVGLMLLVLMVGTVGFGLEASGENPRGPAQLVGLTLISTAPIGVAYLWTACESLRYYAQLRLRLRLGLTDVVVANRVLLWGLMSLAAGTALIINVGGLAAGHFMSPPIVLASSALGLIHAVCLFVAFHPPTWYKGWLERRYAMAG